MTAEELRIEIDKAWEARCKAFDDWDRDRMPGSLRAYEKADARYMRLMERKLRVANPA